VSCIYIYSYSISKHLIKNYFKNYKLIFTNQISEATVLIFLEKHIPKVKENIDDKKIILIKFQNKNSLKTKLELFQKAKTSILDI
jgi:hypothetical protein